MKIWPGKATGHFVRQRQVTTPGERVHFVVDIVPVRYDYLVLLESRLDNSFNNSLKVTHPGDTDESWGEELPGPHVQ